jgi:hypothetical protein
MNALLQKINLKTFVALALIFLAVGFVGILAIGFTSEKESKTVSTEKTPPSTTTTTVDGSTSCNGQATCYGKADLAAHASSNSCWGYIDNVMYDVTPLIKSHTGGTGPIREVCGGDIGAFLNAAPQNNKHVSASSNAAGSTLWGYKIGYYDATKP